MFQVWFHVWYTECRLQIQVVPKSVSRLKAFCSDSIWRLPQSLFWYYSWWFTEVMSHFLNVFSPFPGRACFTLIFLLFCCTLSFFRFVESEKFEGPQTLQQLLIKSVEDCFIGKCLVFGFKVCFSFLTSLIFWFLCIKNSVIVIR